MFHDLVQVCIAWPISQKRNNNEYKKPRKCKNEPKWTWTECLCIVKTAYWMRKTTRRNVNIEEMKNINRTDFLIKMFSGRIHFFALKIFFLRSSEEWWHNSIELLLFYRFDFFSLILFFEGLERKAFKFNCDSFQFTHWHLFESNVFCAPVFLFSDASVCILSSRFPHDSQLNNVLLYCNAGMWLNNFMPYKNIYNTFLAVSAMCIHAHGSQNNDKFQSTKKGIQALSSVAKTAIHQAFDR